jgi:hypothetical protein
MTLNEMKNKDIDLGCLYRMYHNYRYLYSFWQKFQNKRVISDQDIRDRIQYILKNNVKQRDEISTLCWILGEEDVRKKEIND